MVFEIRVSGSGLRALNLRFSGEDADRKRFDRAKDRERDVQMIMS